MNLVSDRDRDAASERLQRAYADGRLTPDEMNVRLEQALTARTEDHLEAALADLPDERVDDVVRLESLRSLRRSGRWRVPRRLQIVSGFGRVRLDLSRAAIEHAEIDIDIQKPYGSATLILPRRATAEVDGVALGWGRALSRVPAVQSAGTLHVRVTGVIGYGKLRIRRSWFR